MDKSNQFISYEDAVIHNLKTSTKDRGEIYVLKLLSEKESITFTEV